MAKQMLMYRAASWWTRTYAPELSLGMKTIDEQQDIYTEFEEVKDVKEQVAAEKEANANQTTIQIDLGDEAPATVDAQTGEIIGEEPAAAPTAAPTETPTDTLPGF